MKTFRFFATLLVITLCAGFTSCSDDDEEENSVEISLANLQGTWDMIKCYGWEYDDNNQKENWTEDVSGEYISGFAFPFIAFIVCPTRKPIAFSFPLW